MRALIARLASPLTALAIAFAMLLAARHTPRAGAEPRLDSEVSRIRAHLLQVERELAAADVSHLGAAQQDARAHHIAVLREYRERGVFPHNHVALDRRLPVFVDEHGTHCAVGYLIASSGRQDIVERIATTRNYASVPELADDAELGTWLGEAGLTVDEAARIQPWYGGIPVPSEPSNRGYLTASMVGTGLGGGAIAWNLLTDRRSDARRLPGAFGLGVGIANIAVGGVGLALDAQEDRRIDAAHIALNFSVGLVSSLLGISTLAGDRAPAATMGDDGSMKEGVQLSLSPWRPVPGEGGAGVRVNLRF
jgi:hypothetical protein